MQQQVFLFFGGSRERSKGRKHAGYFFTISPFSLYECGPTYHGVDNSICACIFETPIPENYQEKVRDILEDTIMERISQLLAELFPQYGLTPPRSCPFPTIVRNLLNEAEAPDRLTALSDMYQSLVENGIQSPFFGEVVRAVLAVMGGGG